MTKSVNKIKDIITLNEPTHNKKYNVWVVRTKTKTGWKAVWRKNKDDANDVYEILQKRIVKSDEKDVEFQPQCEPMVAKTEENDEKPIPTKLSKTIVGKFWNKNAEKVSK